MVMIKKNRLVSRLVSPRLLSYLTIPPLHTNKGEERERGADEGEKERQNETGREKKSPVRLVVYNTPKLIKSTKKKVISFEQSDKKYFAIPWS